MPNASSLPILLISCRLMRLNASLLKSTVVAALGGLLFGFDSSFPSSHSVVAWSAAAVLAGEYPSRWTQLFIYSAATGVSLTRVMGQQHFPSDVLVGSAAGWLVGRYVFRKHHTEFLDKEDY